MWSIEFNNWFARKTDNETRMYAGNTLPYKYEIISELKSFDLGFLWDFEKQEKNRLKNYKYSPKINFPGSSKECFSIIKF